MQKTKCPASMKHTRHMQVQAAEIECLFISLSNFRPHLSNFGCEHPASCFYVSLLRKCTCLLSNCQHTQNILGMKIVSGLATLILLCYSRVPLKLDRGRLWCVFMWANVVYIPLQHRIFLTLHYTPAFPRKQKSNSRKQEKKNLAWIIWGSSLISTPCLCFVVLKMQHVSEWCQKRDDKPRRNNLDFLLKQQIEQKHFVLLVLLN